MMKKRIACMAAVAALCGTFIAGAANYTILEKAEKVETTVYGNVQAGALTDRINSLDETLYGRKDGSGTVQSQTDTLFRDVYGNDGSDLSLLAAVNLMQWKYAGQVTHESLLDRVYSMEQSVMGKAGTGSLDSRITALRKTLLNNEKFTSAAVTIPADTVVKLQNLENLNSKTNKKNDVVHFAVSEDVVVGDVVAIPKGMQLDGTVADVRKAGRFGRDGKMVLAYGPVNAVDGTPVVLTVGDKAKEEYKRTAGAVGASAAGAIILGPIGLAGGLFVNGNNVDLPAGTAMYAETKENTDVIGFKEAAADTTSAEISASGVQTEKHVEASLPSPTTTETAADVKNNKVTPVDLTSANAITGSDDTQTIVTITPDDKK